MDRCAYTRGKRSCGKERGWMGHTCPEPAAHEEGMNCHPFTGQPCPVASSVTGNPCLLTEGHPQSRPWRFHKYAAEVRS